MPPSFGRRGAGRGNFPSYTERLCLSEMGPRAHYFVKGGKYIFS